MNSFHFFKLISEPVRLRVLYLLSQTSLTVTELVKILSLSQSNVSHHIKLLVNDELIEGQKIGNVNLYRLCKKPDLNKVAAKAFSSLELLARELPEFEIDYASLLEVLRERNVADESKKWLSWRKVQPDIPYTYQFAMQGINQKARALDLGCGDGNFSNLLSNHFSSVTGIDLSFELLRSALLSFKNRINFLHSDIHNLPLLNNYFDTTYLRMVLQFCKKPNKVLLESFRVTKENGRIVVIDVTREGDSESKFTKKYFEDLLKSMSGKIRLVMYREYAGVYICTLEKTRA